MSGLATMMAITIAFTGIGAFVEVNFMKGFIPYLYEPAPAFPAFPRIFGLVVLALTSFSFWQLSFGMNVGKARKEAREKAEKDGEADLDKYDYPNLYAYGNSKPAVAFNSVQRAHQHVLESITQMYMATLFAATVFPATAALSAFLWAYGRICWSTAYAEKGKDLRYSHPLSVWIWRGMLANLFLCFTVVFIFVFGSA